jgi:hypothetical protein
MNRDRFRNIRANLFIYIGALMFSVALFCVPFALFEPISRFQALGILAINIVAGAVMHLVGKWLRIHQR